MFEGCLKNANLNNGLTATWLRRLGIQEIYSSANANFKGGLAVNWLGRLETQGIYPSSFAVTPNSVLPLQPEARITANSQEYIGK